MSNSDILREFLLETHENLATLDADLVKLEKNPTEKSTLAQVFRTLHSVKGAAGFMGLVKLQAVAHSAESLLSRLRNGELLLTPQIATALLRVVDAIREILASIEKESGEGAGDYTALIAELDRLREGTAAFTPAKAIEPKPLSLPPRATEETTPAKPLGLPPAPLPVQTSAPLPAPMPEPPSPQAPSSDTTVFRAVELPLEPKAAQVADTNIRVDVSLLDKLMNLMGELVLARNQILQYSASHADEGYLSAVQRLNLLTTDLQASVMKTRMQPIGNLFGKFPRIVRDLAVACGKKVNLEIEGQETELDKSLLEAIRDPLTHMVRNSVDHGIESPEVRRALGKSEEGRLRLLAYHEGGKVIIEITDDGGGIDVDRVREKALGAGLVSPEAIARMSRSDILRLIFLPGFSTAEKVTQFSGRGVGMDVVRTNIEKIGGTIDIESPLGKGTTVRTKIPLTLAIIPALIVICGDQRFAIPQVSLLELLYLDAEKAERGIERIHGAPVYRLRGNLLPLVFLNEQLKLESERLANDGLHIIVLQADDRPFGLVVDAIRDTEEIVVKPLQKQLKGIPVFAGAAIMGDGRIALVLDILGLAHHAHVISGAKSGVLSEQDRPAATVAKELEPILLFAARGGGQMAIPLSQVARLEELPRADFEQLGERQVIQYRGAILPLVDVAQALDELSGSIRALPPQSEIVPIIVYTLGNERVGLIVDRIVDVVADAAAAEARATRAGILHTAIVQDKVTEFIDVAALTRHSASLALA